MKNQKKILKSIFEARKNQWIPCYEVVQVALQYNARIKELREDGMHITNKLRVVDGIRKSWFRYTPGKQLELGI